MKKIFLYIFITAQLLCIWVKSNESFSVTFIAHYNSFQCYNNTNYNALQLQITSLLCNAPNSLTLNLASSFRNWLMSYQSEWFACAFKQYFLGNTAVVMQCVIAAKFWLVIPIPWTINPIILYAANLWAHFCTFIVQYTEPMHLFRNILEPFLTSPVCCFFSFLFRMQPKPQNSADS